MLVQPDLFVNRARELEEFGLLLEGLRRGHRRHVALLGLRRIGKTVLLDEVRRRHPGFPICYVAVDQIASSPETFARALTGQLLATAAARKALEAPILLTDVALAETAVALHPKLVTLVQEILEWIAKANYGSLLISALGLPGHLSDLLDIPLLVMLDEFQDIVRLRDYPNTANLLGTLRAALDRPGRVGFAIAGSRVTVLRKLIGDGESPLFTRFGTIPLAPFGTEATRELATRIWEIDPMVTSDPDAIERLYRLSRGWPLYVGAIARRSQQIARSGTRHITSETVDLAFRQELFGRGTALGQHCAYLRETAGQSDSNGARNLLEEVLNQVSVRQPVTRSGLVRRLSRRYNSREVYRAVNRLIDTDFLAEQDGVLTLLDPVFALWLAAEPARQDPQGILSDDAASRKLLSWYEQRHAEDRSAMGSLFEKRVENLVRQFSGQGVEGGYFGISGEVVLPRVRGVQKVRVDDPQSLYGEGPDSYEIDLVTSGDGPEDCWAVECKHRRGALTVRMVERFVSTARAVARARGLEFARLWIVSNRGIRAEAAALVEAEGMLTSGSRQIERLERLLAGA